MLQYPQPQTLRVRKRSFLIKIAACCSGVKAPNWGLRPRSPVGELDTRGIRSNNEVIERCASERVALELGASPPLQQAAIALVPPKGG